MKCWLAEARMEATLLSASSCSDLSGPCQWQPGIHEWKIISSVTEFMFWVFLAGLRSLAPSPLAWLSMGLSSWGPEIGEATGNDLLVPDLLVQLFLR